MRTDAAPLAEGARATIKFQGGLKRRVRFLRVEELPEPIYRVAFRDVLARDPALAALPAPGDSLFVIFQNAAARPLVFAGFAGYPVTHFLAREGGQPEQAWPLEAIGETMDGQGQRASGAQYRQWARAHRLPSRTVIVVEGASGEERIRADRLVEIKSRVRHRRVMVSLAAGLAVDVGLMVWLVSRCGLPCIADFD